MKIVGVIGGIGVGKTHICNIIEEQGYVVHSFDEDAKHVMCNDLTIIEEMKKLFGDDIYEVKQESNISPIQHILDRKKLASIIFTDDEMRIRVEKLIKPVLFHNFYKKAYDYQYNHGKKYFFVESATIIKTGFFKMLDQIILIDADMNLRREMVCKNRDITVEDFNNRVKMQMPLDEIIRTLDLNFVRYTLFDNDYSEKARKWVLDYISSNI